MTMCKIGLTLILRNSIKLWVKSSLKWRLSSKREGILSRSSKPTTPRGWMSSWLLWRFFTMTLVPRWGRQPYGSLLSLSFMYFKMSLLGEWMLKFYGANNTCFQLFQDFYYISLNVYVNITVMNSWYKFKVNINPHSFYIICNDFWHL